MLSIIKKGVFFFLKVAAILILIAYINLELTKVIESVKNLASSALSDSPVDFGYLGCALGFDTFLLSLFSAIQLGLSIYISVAVIAITLKYFIKIQQMFWS